MEPELFPRLMGIWKSNSSLETKHMIERIITTGMASFSKQHTAEFVINVTIQILFQTKAEILNAEFCTGVSQRICDHFADK